LKKLPIVILALISGQTLAQSGASAPYTPTWMARHHLQWLADNTGLELPTTQWPLPASAVEQSWQPDGDVPGANAARDHVNNELQAVREHGRMQLHLRSQSEGLNGYGESYTPGISASMVTAELRAGDADGVSFAGRLGARLEAQPNSMQAQIGAWGQEGRTQFRPQASAAVLGVWGWNVQAFTHQFWWGPGWQSSLVNGHNSPAWMGVGMQRGTVRRSDSALLSWMGPWNLDVFVAKAQDPQVVDSQPTGFLFSGLRLTMKPQSWLELGLTRGLQTAGAGRPRGAGEFVKAFLGQQTNKDLNSPFQDSSNQVAGYDVRVRCPQSWGGCAAYTQWMGEDAAGKYPPWPYRFMRLWGADKTFAQGRYRVFAEYANTFTTGYQSAGLFPGYTNGVYTQGYTNGARWVGSAQGGASEVSTLGWMDADQMRMVKLHAGRIGLSLGAYAPGLNAPHGRMWGMSAQQSLRFMGMLLTPELAYTQLADGADQGVNRRKNLRVGMAMSVPLWPF
jgi:hypothetical protein